MELLSPYVVSQFYFSADRPNCATFPSLKCAHISLWLNPTGHFKIHNTSNTLHLLPTPVGLLVLSCTRQCMRFPPPPALLPASIYFLTRTEEPAKSDTCCRDTHALQQLALNVHVKHSDLTLGYVRVCGRWGGGVYKGGSRVYVMVKWGSFCHEVLQ